ncbi:MAG: hypothetical protein QNJ69_12755, partial [Gammaproteobacteria bacterium]|nr:hypothetical protein [Gammaproteobacteria bacterium]
IQEEFDRLAREDYESLLRQLKKIKTELALDDWAYIQLILKLSQEYTSDKNAATVLSWFILIKNGFTTRVAYSSNEIYLLLSTQQKLYDIQFFVYDKQKFYVISDHAFIAKSLFSYNGRYPKKLDAANLKINERARFNTAINSRALSFRYKGDKYQVSVPVEKEYVDHLSTFPQMDIDVYFATRPSAAVSNALLQQLRPLVKDREQQDAVNFLLRFVQTAFKYATDKQQFGKENYLYIEESISYPSSDCEDRSILFAWLVRNLLGLEVVGLDFPGHIATAVLLDKPVGQTVRHRGKTFTVTDPTYINARAGMKMPQFKNTQPKVIPIS